jgi:hypothetical protein
MKELTLSFIMAFGFLMGASVLALDSPKASATHNCDFHINPYGGGVLQCPPPSDNLPRIISDHPSWFGHHGLGNDILLVNPHSFPSDQSCPMCGAIVLDKSLFSNNTQIKISPQKDGSMVINVENSTSTSNFNTTNSTNNR